MLNELNAENNNVESTKPTKKEKIWKYQIQSFYYKENLKYRKDKIKKIKNTDSVKYRNQKGSTY